MAKWTFPESTNAQQVIEILRRNAGDDNWSEQEIKELFQAKDDGRPCNTDTFLVHLLEHEDDHYNLRARIKDWIEGAWEEALDELPELKL